MKRCSRLFLSLALATLFAGAAQAGEPTAYDLIKAGDQYVGVQSKD